MNRSFDIHHFTNEAIKYFWRTRSEQFKHSSDSSNRGAVVGGRQMDGFLSLLKKACVSIGVPEKCIYEKNNYVPGFFRSSKDWDFMIISPTGKLLVVIELKSQIGSYGKNFNNRTEEALGNGTDLWTAYRERQFPTFGIPWVGFLMLIGEDEESTIPVKNHENHFLVLPEFKNASYIDRYRILCEKLMAERLYTSACLIRTKDSSAYSEVSSDLSIDRFVKSLQGYLIGCSDEFDK